MSLTFESVHMRTVSVPLRNPIVSKVGQFTHWPLILIDVHTREGITGHSYLEPYVEKAIPAICSMIQVLADHFKGKPLAPLDIYSESLKMFHLVGREGISLIDDRDESQSLKNSDDEDNEDDGWWCMVG